MAKVDWLGRALAIAQLETITVTGPVVAAETWTVTINGKSYTHAAVAGTTADVTAGLVALLNASEELEFSSITWADADPDITATADDAGVPFTLTVSTNSAGGSIATVTTTAATGPNHADNVNNWSSGTVPAAADDVHVQNTAVSILYGLDGIDAVTFASFHVHASFTGEIGLPKTNDAGYPEYRAEYLLVDSTLAFFHEGEGSGSGRLKIDFDTIQTAIEVRGTGGALETGVPALLIKGTHASNTLDVHDGTVGVAFFGTEVAAVVTSSQSGGDVILGPGCTLTTLQVQGGSLVAESNSTTITQDGGTVTILGSATVGTIDLREGVLDYLSSGTATTVNIGGKPNPATIDCSRDRSGRTFTTTTLHENGRIVDPAKTITHTNGVAVGANVSEVNAA